MRTFLRYWLPVVLWTLLILVASTDLMSAQHTSRFIGPFLRWFVPDIAAETIVSVQFAVRKAAHVTEYAILAALLFRAMRAENRRLSISSAVASTAIAAVVAATDEFHQSFVRSRTGSPGDVVIDVAGALLGVAIYWWVVMRRGAAPNNSNTARPAIEQ